MAALEFELPIDEHVLYALRKQGRLGISGVVADGSGIKDGDIGKITRLEQTAVAEALALCRQRRHFANALLERQQVKIADVMPEKPRHGAEGPRMAVGLKERAIERELIRVQA